jgi:hypothetical protein
VAGTSCERDKSLGTHHIAHGITLKTKFLGQIQEYVFDFFLGKWDLALGRPGRVRLADVGCGAVVGIGGSGRTGRPSAGWTIGL